MSGEEENKRTSTEKSVKIKDLKRVELGKRLAKISKEAKERKINFIFGYKTFYWSF